LTPLRALGGTSDILPEEARAWQQLEEKARRVFHLYGYQEIRTPLIEEAALFTRSLGEAAEIVTKQIYLFEDRGGRSVALRPEGTASVVRAFIEHGMDKTASLSRFYYLGPMFRAERPQAGRKRQFHQVGVEALGSASPYQDVEVLALLVQILKEFGLKMGSPGEPGVILKLNNLGCRNDRPVMLKKLADYFAGHLNDLCEDCRQRFKVNPLRILDCKNEKCRSIAHGSIPPESEWLCADCRAHVDTVKKALAALKINFEWDPRLVRGLDYYSRTAFEIVHPEWGAQNAVGGGGRYDDLVAMLGGNPTPAVGFAIGLERILLALGEREEKPQGPKVFIATVTAADIPDGMALAETARRKGISVVPNLEDRPLKRQMEQAEKLGCSATVIRGESERAKGVVLLKKMASREQIEISEGTWVETLQKFLSE